jgi:hypothetical protein
VGSDLALHQLRDQGDRVVAVLASAVVVRRHQFTAFGTAA